MISIELTGIFVILPFTVLTIGSGLSIPAIVSHALSLHRERTGTAASAIGTVQNLAAFPFSSISAYFTHYHYNGLIATYGLLFFFLLLNLIAYTILTRYDGRKVKADLLK